MEERFLELVRLMIKNRCYALIIKNNDRNTTLVTKSELGSIPIKSQENDYQLIRYLQYLGGLQVGYSDAQSDTFHFNVDGEIRYFNIATEGERNHEIATLKYLGKNEGK